MIVVLPTADIVREYEHFDALFVFYDDGIRGLVRDTILLSEGWTWMMHKWRTEEELRKCLDPLVGKVLRDYSNSTEALLQRLSENTSAEMYVELVVEEVWRRVMGMMHDLFRHLVYDVSRAEYRWIGNDLATVMRFYN